MTETGQHKWEFRARFRRGAFGWRSHPAIERVNQAVSEIKKVARKDPALAGEGAMIFLERVSPALEQVDGSSGAMGGTVNWAIAELVPVIAQAPVEKATRAKWLERLFQAHADDDIPWIEVLAEYWGELCASPEVSSEWADRLLEATRRDIGPGGARGSYFHGSMACLSSLFHAGRHAELIEVVAPDSLWLYRRWVVRALVAMGKKAEAIRYAESCRGPNASDLSIDRVCEGILLSSGLHDEAYRRYGLRANKAGTYLATFRQVAKKYPHKQASEILNDLVATTPGSEGKWFAAAKDAGLFEEALALATKSPTDPKTLTRAARDYAKKKPEFAVEAGLLALAWLVKGYGYEVTAVDVWDAYDETMAAAERLGVVEETRGLVRAMVKAAGSGLVAEELRRRVGDGGPGEVGASGTR
jgi:hypothetical protein